MAEQTSRPTVQDEQEAVVQDIVSLIADGTGSPPMELSPPLESAVDTDALRKLVRRSTTDLRVAFPYQGREVVVEADGEVTISAPRTEQ